MERLMQLSAALVAVLAAIIGTTVTIDGHYAKI